GEDRRQARDGPPRAPRRARRAAPAGAHPARPPDARAVGGLVVIFEQIERACSFYGPALPEPFVKLSLEGELRKRGLLLPEKGDEAKARQARWDVFRRKLGKVPAHAGALAVKQRVLEPLAALLGYERVERAEPV